MKQENATGLIDYGRFSLGGLLDIGADGICRTRHMLRREALRHLALPLNVQADTISRWINGQRPFPVEPRVIEFLARECCRKGGMDRAWLEAFLMKAGHRDPESLILRVLHMPPKANFHKPQGSLIGRENLLRETLTKLVRAGEPLINVVGPPGVGKTRLAHEIVEWLRDAYDDGVIWVAENDVKSVKRAYQQLAKAVFEVLEISNLNSSNIKQIFKGRHILLFFDNFDAYPTARQVVTELLSLAATADLQIIVTSPEKLNVDKFEGCVTLVDPLTYPPDAEDLPDVNRLEAEFTAIELLASLIRRQPDHEAYKITGKDAKPIARICAELDGLPGAIELWAGACADRGIQYALKLIEARQKPLTTHPEDHQDNKLTFYDNIALIYNRLNKNTQRFLRRLAVFPGSFTPEAMEAVCSLNGDLSGEVDTGLSILKNWYLLQSQLMEDGSIRYRFLQPIYDFALERLKESGELEMVQEAHAEHYRKLAAGLYHQPLWRPDENEVNAIKLEFHNLRAAVQFFARPGKEEKLLRIASELALLWPIAYQLTDIQSILMEGLERVKAGRMTLPEAILARAYLAVGVMAWRHGHWDEAEGFIKESLKLSQELGDQTMILYNLNYLGSLARNQCAWDQADALFKECLELCRALGDKTGEAMQLDNLGNERRYQQRHEEGIEFCKEALRLRTEMKDLWGQAGSTLNLARLYLGMGCFQTAAQYGHAALDMYIQAFTLWDKAASCEALAEVARSQKRPLLTARLLGAAEVFRQLGSFTPPEIDRVQSEQVLKWALSYPGAEDAAKDANEKGRYMSPDEAWKAANVLLRKKGYGLNTTQSEIACDFANGRSVEDVRVATKLPPDKFQANLLAIGEMLEILTRLPPGSFSRAAKIDSDGEGIDEAILQAIAKAIGEAMRELDAQT